MNCSPPNVATHGFMPPVPNAITIIPTAAKALTFNVGGPYRRESECVSEREREKEGEKGDATDDVCLTQLATGVA